MATTNIELDIENITGVADANDQFVISAQKFVVSSVPKNLLHFAQKASSASTDGSAISFSVNDSIIDVQRNGYSCREISMSESIWALDSTSLKYATAKHPVWYHKQGSVHFAPVTDGSNAGYVFYVDYSKIDDDSDLRNAVVFHAASSEFSKLSSAEMPTVSIAAVPPDVPSLSTVSFSETNALSISVSAPTAISLTSVTFSSTDSDVDASLPTYTTATVSAGGVYGANTAPAYTKPELTSRAAFNDYWTLGDFGDSDPGPFGLVASPPATPSAPSFSTPAVSAITIGALPSAPDYTAPVFTSASTYLTEMEAGTLGASASDIDAEHWFSIAGQLIEDEEDTELAAVHLQKINTFISAFQSDMQNQLNIFNEGNAVYQASIQRNIEQARIDAQDAQQEANLKLQEENQEYAATLQKYQADVGKYQAEVGKEVQEYTQKLSRYQLELNTVFQAWQKTESDSLSQYQADIQNELNEFNKENIPFQANMQESMQEIQVANQVNIAKAQGELQLNIDNENRSQQRQLQNGINDMQAIVADNERKIAQYQAEASHYATQVNQYIQNYTSRLQKDIQDTQAIIANNDDLLAKYQSELQQYTGEVQAELGEYQNKIQKQQTLSKEADKYYNWAKMEVNMYIQNNSKMIAATMASRSQAAQQQRS